MLGSLPAPCFHPQWHRPAANESFGISNPFAIPELVTFEIFNRWGGRVFVTTDVFGKWDGSFDGQDVNPGVHLWRVVYRCQGQDVVKTGSVTVLR
ncbi:MAG: hypothetical protein HC821_00410 [Lewinella sp.]|nr:hypothetical protein [Lewinella sp.]